MSGYIQDWATGWISTSSSEECSQNIIEPLKDTYASDKNNELSFLDSIRRKPSSKLRGMQTQYQQRSAKLVKISITTKFQG